MRVLLAAVLAPILVAWATGAFAGARPADTSGWRTIRVPGTWEQQDRKLAQYDGFAWYRCFVKVPKEFAGQPTRLELGSIDDCDETFVNGRKVGATGRLPPNYEGLSGPRREYLVPADCLRPGAWNLIAVRVYDGGGEGGLMGGAAMRLASPRGEIALEGTWQFRTGDDMAWAQWPADPTSAEGEKVAENFATLARAAGQASIRAALTGKAEPPASPLAAWYRQPAREWVEALPIGGGRLGAMVFGGVEEEHLQFNEDTLWTGGPHEYQHEGAKAHLATIRRLLAEGKQREAQDLAGREFMSVPLHQKAYQPFGDLRVHFTGHDTAADYRRDLDLDSAVAAVRYRVGDVAYERRAFASHPDQVIVLRLSADKKGAVSFAARLDSPHKSAQTRGLGVNQLVMAGHVEDGGMKFESRLRVVAEGGRTNLKEGEVTVEGADAATLILAAATNFKNYHDTGADPAQRCEATMKAVAGKTFDGLVKAHLEDYRQLFRRVTLDLGRTAAAALPTDERLKAAARQDDPQLATLYFQFGRYLMISCSRPGGQPANLQGLWNDQLHPPWESKWTTNINTEMNYWPAEVTNLSECHEPLFDLIEDCAVTGRKTAEAHYGARGWVLHHNTDLWRGTAPINASDHGIWVTGGAWLCHHLWDHYRFTCDKGFLARRAYPAMKGAATFFADFLVKDPKTGWLISTPSNSPEIGGLVAGPTMDHQIIRDLFANTAEAARILGVDADLAARLLEMRQQIAPNQIGKHGQLQEWLEDKDNPQEQHRHVSHLWGLYPGWEITPRGTPDLMKAARQSLLFRGDGGTGWSKAWKINFWARLLDGDHAHRMVVEALAGNTYPNLFDAHPPFQIDGNFGGTAGIAEMLIQSHTSEIELLPALPKAWPTGSFKGLLARGGFEVDATWKDGALAEATFRSKLGGTAKVRYGQKVLDVQVPQGKALVLTGDDFRR
jgi:alpha-L-fucosidase 2